MNIPMERAIKKILERLFTDFNGDPIRRLEMLDYDGCCHYGWCEDAVEKVLREELTYIDCPECDGRGEVCSGYYKHPETSDFAGPLMYRCSLCKGRGVITEMECIKHKNSKSYDPF